MCKFVSLHMNKRYTRKHEDTVSLLIGKDLHCNDNILERKLLTDRGL